MGAATAIFSMSDAIVNRPFAFPDLDRLMSIAATVPKADTACYPVSPADYFDCVRRSRSFVNLAALQSWDAQLAGNQESKPLHAVLASPSFFSLIGNGAAPGTRLCR